jgi:hypothetical protein
MRDLTEHLRRQMAFSRATYGPGERTNGVCDHIAKEVQEIKGAPDDGKRSNEWVDVVILGFDGMWRALEAEGVPWDMIPSMIAHKLSDKQSKNEQRDWPDWRTADPDKAIEHVRGDQS